MPTRGRNLSGEAAAILPIVSYPAAKRRFSVTLPTPQILRIGLYTEEQLYFSARKLYAKKIRKGSVRLLGITVSKLQTAIIQDSLFAEEPTTKKRLADEKVTTAIDKLQERFGKRAVMKGFLWEAESSVKEVKEKE